VSAIYHKRSQISLSIFQHGDKTTLRFRASAACTWSGFQPPWQIYCRNRQRISSSQRCRWETAHRTRLWWLSQLCRNLGRLESCRLNFWRRESQVLTKQGMSQIFSKFLSALTLFSLLCMMTRRECHSK